MGTIRAKAQFGANQELKGVTAKVEVLVLVDVNLFEDGAFTLRGVRGVSTDAPHIELSADDIEETVGNTYTDDDLADAYADAVELQLGVSDE